MPTPADLALLALILIGYPLWDYYWAWPRARDRLASGNPNARRSLYRSAMVTQWLAASLVAALWIAYRRPAGELWLRLPGGWRLVAAAGLVLGAIALVAGQMAGVARADAESRESLRPKLEYAAAILPRTRNERAWFMALSATAGLCEELIYRGFVVWALVPWLGLWPAALVSVAGFGVAHAYLGRQGVVRATLAGAVFAVVVVGLGSLYPAMILHAALDIGAGALGYALLRDASGEGSLAGRR